MEITRTVETSTPVEKVFPYLADFTTTTEWDPGTVRTERVSGDGGPGTVYHNVSSFNGRETELEYTVVERTEGARFQLRGVNKTLVATDTMTFSATPAGGTRVVYHADFAFQGLLGKVEPVLGLFLGKAFAKLGDEAQQGMQRALDKL